VVRTDLPGRLAGREPGYPNGIRPLFRYILARRFATRYIGRRAAGFLPGGWLAFFAYPLVRRALRRRMRQRAQVAGAR